MEIDEQTQGNTEQLHITEQLGFMYGQNLFNTFQFEQQAVFNQNVKPQRLLKPKPLYSIFTSR